MGDNVYFTLHLDNLIKINRMEQKNMKTDFYQTPENFTLLYAAHGLYLYESECDYMLESWGASTKHPDTINYYSDSDFIKNQYIDRCSQVFNFLCYCASLQFMPYHAMKIASFAIEYAEKFEPDFLRICLVA